MRAPVWRMTGRGFWARCARSSGTTEQLLVPQGGERPGRAARPRTPGEEGPRRDLGAEDKPRARRRQHSGGLRGQAPKATVKITDDLTGCWRSMTTRPGTGSTCTTNPIESTFATVAPDQSQARFAGRRSPWRSLSIEQTAGARSTHHPSPWSVPEPPSSTANSRTTRRGRPTRSRLKILSTGPTIAPAHR
jgi:hypothetical protein